MSVPNESGVFPLSQRSATAVALIADADGVIRSVSGASAEVLGVDASEMIGISADALLASTPVGSLVDLRLTGKPARWDGVVLRPPAPDTPRSLAVFPMGDESTGAVIVVSPLPEPDVDRELALRTSNAQLESFASVAAHDLQEPLRKIRAFSDRVRSLLDPDSAEKALDYLGRVDVAAARMQTLITDLLALARLSGRPPERVEISLDDIIESALQELADRVEQVGATVDVTPLPGVVADPSQMRQLFTNLLGNSLKYRRPEIPVHITVRAEQVDGRVVIRVRDNGIGFSDQYLTKIFAPFERLHGRDEYEGTGVGLALCRTIVERHGGTITAHGEPGEGAEFVIDLPAS